MKSILKVGITGGIGVGKTTVAKMFQLLGIALYNADERAKVLVTENLDLKKSIINLVGDEAYLPTGNYNTIYIKQQIFSHNNLLSELNQLIHPAVAIDFTDWVVQQSGAYEKDVKLYLANDWNLKEETPEYFLLTRNEGSTTGHVLIAIFTLWWTFGIANLIYYFAKKKTKKIVK